ncbi:MAG: 2-oxo-4-hydroxy-4-carboxy-5-ureidoimidazoline decarboxylase [Planctomycetota bacterium]
MTLDELNQLAPDDAAATLRGCCGCAWWAEQLAAARPYGDPATLHDVADAVFDVMAEAHWQEAFAAHPKIGETKSAKMRDAGNRQWSADEQAGTADPDDTARDELTALNAEYLERFGYIFIVCATGLSADRMLADLRRRLRHDPRTEAGVAAAEQRKITHLRLDKLLADGG